MDDNFFEDEASRLLTPAAFEFALHGELKRAVRSQNYLTLVVLEAKREWNDLMLAADEGTLAEVADIVGPAVRETDLFAKTDTGTLSLALLDADFAGGGRVIERLATRFDSYGFPSALHISIGAACYPTQAVDADSLRRQAASHPVIRWRGGPPLAETGDSH
jgi:hypothetical protein